ncbi:MAG: PilZ domain-containing protein [Gammaproteobacteria bacterium]|nr:PilZ domain-containing protein [Gammaproteobacteria bacterium]
MENRWVERTPIQLDLVIYYGPIGLIRAQTKDISANGMYVNTGLISLAPDEQIKITLSYATAVDKVTCQMTGQVIHSDSDGAGIAFIDSPIKDLDYVLKPPLSRSASY